MRFLTTLLIFTVCSASAQKQGYNWYFGYLAAISFNGGPHALKGGSMVTNEGCATISNSSGSLLFYTDGGTIWNRNHTTMPTTVNLKGDYSSTQSAVIVPNPSDSNIYYVFTVDKEAGPDGLKYSTVDMTKLGGLGNVTSLNNNLRTPVSEKLTSARHFNQKDYWVIAHDWNSNNYVSYLVTSAGVSTTPVLSATGSVHANNNNGWMGYMKISPSGTRVASAITGNNIVELFNFDSNTGILSNPITLSVPNPYGLEFSRDDAKLYISTKEKKEVFQYTLTDSSISSSRKLIETDSLDVAALQLGPDGKIYVSRAGDTYLGAINYPSLDGKACNYQRRVVSLGGNICRYGLPTFIQSFFLSGLDFYPTTGCTNLPVQFQGISNAKPDKWIWNFGDTASSFNTSSVQNPTHNYSKPGVYKVRLTIQIGLQSDTVMKDVTVMEQPVSPAKRIYHICRGQKQYLDVGNPGMQVLWKNGDTGHIRLADSQGVYHFTVTNGFCVLKDSFTVIYHLLPLNLGPDKFICEDNQDTIILDAGNHSHFLWTPANPDQRNFFVTKPGTYRVYVIDSTCYAEDSIHILSKCPPNIYVPNAFSPNKDGINDTFKIKGTDITKFQMKIFNRWGELIYSGTDFTDGWTGNQLGNKAPDGLYHYEISYDGIYENIIYSKYLKGIVYLLR